MLSMIVVGGTVSAVVQCSCCLQVITILHHHTFTVTVKTRNHLSIGGLPNSTRKTLPKESGGILLARVC